jgi:O-antigen/teichoic acid export membrane protein
LLESAKRRNPLPTGTLVVGCGLIIAGLSAFAFIALASRALPNVEYAPLGAQWSLVFLLGPGLFLPIEQEVSRALSARRARGLGGEPVVRKAATFGVALALAILVLLIATSRFTVDEIFDGHILLLVGVAFGLVGALSGHLLRGCLSGTNHFKGYGAYLGADGFIRFLGCALCAIIGIETAGWYGIAVGVAGLIAVPVALKVEKPDLHPGPEAAWDEVSRNIFLLLGASICAWSLMNIGPVIMKLLATDAQTKAAGRFVSAIVVARIPLFLFQAIQASLLPKLSAHASAGQLIPFRRGLKRLLVVVAGLAVAGTVVGWAIGPFVVQKMSGPEFVMQHRTMGLLAAGSGFYMLALAIAQAVIALGGHGEQVIGWFSGIVAFFLSVFFVAHDLYLRVELALLIGSFTAFVVMGALLFRRLGEKGPGELCVESGDFIEALHDVNVVP